MAYINTAITEGDLLEELKDIIVTNGWTFIKSFLKGSYPNELIMPTYAGIDTTKIDLTVAEHYIFQNEKGQHYGVAKPYTFSKTIKKLKEESGVTSFPMKDGGASETTFNSWLETQYKKFSGVCSLYCYMIDDVPATAQGGYFGCASELALRGAIDLENEKSAYIANGTGSYTFEFTETYPERQQSPFAYSTLRNTKLATTDVATNWWPDSLVRVQGFIDTNTLAIVLQADNTPAFQFNVVPSIPVYWGSFESFKTGDATNFALWMGTAFDTGTETASHSYDFKSTTPYRTVANLMPYNKTYPSYPGNGIDNIIVKRSELGARYQAYYLSWNAAPQMMPPDRVGEDGGQYPLSWTTYDNDEYKYKFNPSVYSNKIHTSRAYLVHPDEGVRGYLSKFVMLAPMGLVNEDKLKVRTATCPDAFDVYRFFLTSAISPVSKRPGTVYTPAGIGIFEKSI